MSRRISDTPGNTKQENTMWAPTHTAMEVRTDGRFTVEDEVVFSVGGGYGEIAGGDIVKGTVEQVIQVSGGGRSMLRIRSDSGVSFTRHACDVQHATGWQERVDPSVAAAVGDGSGPLPIRLHPETPAGPGVSVYWMAGSVLVVGIYTSATQGTVYRWLNGLAGAPDVIKWDLNGPPCS